MITAIYFYNNFGNQSRSRRISIPLNSHVHNSLLQFSSITIDGTAFACTTIFQYLKTEKKKLPNGKMSF